MQDYRQFEPEELATDSSFQRWKLAHDPVSTRFWNEWLIQNPDKIELVEKAYYLLITLNTLYEPGTYEQHQISEQEIQEEVHQRLFQAINHPRKVSVTWFQLTPVRYGMAASLLILLSLFGWYWRGTTVSGEADKMVTYKELVAQANRSLSEVSNPTDKPLVINLPDRSTILLYPKSRVSYSKQFVGTKREVYLSGEAFFEVAKNPTRPFYVYANGLVTKVLGTSFVVETNEKDRQVKVVVKTGKVSVFAQNQATLANQKEDYKLGGTVLMPNQQVVFSTGERRLVKSLVQKPAPIEKTVQKQSFEFKRTPIAEVFATLEQAYNIQIIFDEEIMRDCYLTASLSNETLFDQLDLICRTINARYDQLDAYVVIDSKGCK